MRALKKHVLFIAPSFMNYENAILDYLSSEYYVTYLDTELLLKNVRARYNQLPYFIRGLLKVFHGIRERVRDNYLEQELKTQKEFQKKLAICFNTSYDYIITINGDGLPNSIASSLRYSQQCAKMVLYLWDDYDLLFKTNHIRFFNQVFSFNPLDCKKYSYRKLSMFTPNNKAFEKNLFKKEYDICMIGSATPERVMLVKKLKKLYSDKYSMFIYLFCKDAQRFDIQTFQVPLNFDEYMDAVSKSRCLFEIVRAHQKGPTTRVNDCKFVKTKIITTNDCRESYCGNGKNTWFIDDTMRIPEDFVRTPYDINIEPGVTVEYWISVLLKG